jgi:SAM-dependent methyltransferase
VASDEHGWEQWPWDDTVFAGAAPYYARGRPPYSPALADAFRAALALDGSGRLLDVGCGPGTITIPLAHLFTSVVGLDADAQMLTEARRLATEQQVDNAAWVHLRAEQLPAGLGTFRVITFAASFHWMDRPRVASSVRTMLDPGGAVVHVDAPAYRNEQPAGAAEPAHPPVPDDAIAALRRRYLGPDTRAGHGIRNTSPSGEDAVFQTAGFAPAERVTVRDGRWLERTVDDVIAHVLSSSATAPKLFGDRLDAFIVDLRRSLDDASSSGMFSVQLPDNRLNIWRPRS